MIFIFQQTAIIIILNYDRKPKKITAGVLDVNSSLKSLEEVYSDNSLYGMEHHKYNITYGEIMCDSIDNIFNNIITIVQRAQNP